MIYAPSNIKRSRRKKRSRATASEMDKRAEFLITYAEEQLDAIPPDQMRWLVESTIKQHVDEDQLRILRVAEESEREQLASFARRASA